MSKSKDWESAIDQQIREALERGAFDDLPGRGKPLDLTPNPYARDQEMAFKILKDAGYAPEWIELDKAIRMHLDRARQVLARHWQWHQARLDSLAGRSDAGATAEKQRSVASWQAAIAEFEEQVVAINKEIGELNLQVPALHLQRPKVDAAREVARVQEGEA